MFRSLSPDAYKALSDYPDIVYGLAASPYGDMAVAWWMANDAQPPSATGNLICYFALHADLQKTTEQLHTLFPHNLLTRDDKRAKEFAKRYFGPQPEKPPVLMKGTPFFLTIWETLYHTEPGLTLSYGELAKRAGRPLASRAVGRAMATNPIALVVPCHRVLSSDGSLGGYGYGPDIKKRLLAVEQARV